MDEKYHTECEVQQLAYYNDTSWLLEDVGNCWFI